MAKFVTKFKFIKPGKKAGGYVKYIAAREGVDKIDDSKKHLPAFKKQEELIEKILRNFPDTKDMHEYDDYRRTMTVADASEFITRALEDNAQEMMTGKTYASILLQGQERSASALTVCLPMTESASISRKCPRN